MTMQVFLGCRYAKKWDKKTNRDNLINVIALESQIWVLCILVTRTKEKSTNKGIKKYILN